MATVDMANLIQSATDNCGNVIVTTVGGTPVIETLSLPLPGGNGNFGNMFDVNAITDITVNSFDVHGDTGAVFDVNVWANCI
jgi:hypothetical protein